MRLKMKNGSHRYDMNRTKPRHGHKYTKHKIDLSMMIGMCSKQHLKLNSLKKLSNTKTELKKKLIKKVSILSTEARHLILTETLLKF